MVICEHGDYIFIVGSRRMPKMWTPLLKELQEVEEEGTVALLKGGLIGGQ